MAEADLRDADLKGAEIREANLTGADIKNAVLAGVNMRDTDLSETSFINADIVNANLQEANLSGANIEKADFTGADLESADLSEANLFDADFEGTDLYGATLDGASINRETEFGSHYISTASSEDILSQFRHWRSFLINIQQIVTLTVCLSQSESPDSERWSKAAWTFRRVEQLSEDSGLSKQARSYNVHRKDVERRLYLIKENSRLRWIMALLSSLVMRYGESPWRVVGFSVLIIITAAAGYMWHGLRLTGGEESMLIGGGAGSISLPTLIGKSLYFSTITFTTVGYGDIHPVGWSQTIATMESFLGALLMALLVYVLGRRATW